MYESRVGGVDKVEVMFRGSKGAQRRKEAILVRTVDLACRERGAEELLAELTQRKGYRRVCR